MRLLKLNFGYLSSRSETLGVHHHKSKCVLALEKSPVTKHQRAAVAGETILAFSDIFPIILILNFNNVFDSI